MRLRSPSRLRAILFGLRRPLAPSGHPDSFNASLREAVEAEFAGLMQNYELDAEEFWRFKESCGYAADYVRYMGPELLNEKLLEHFVSLKLLSPKSGETLIDIGSAESPFAEYVERTLGCSSYSLDLAYPDGVHGRKIGASADAIPLETGSVDALTLHCTIDHFEGYCDSRFIHEAARVMRPGGRLCILPVYFAPEPTNICDPRHYSPSAEFDAGAQIRRVAGYSNRFGRYYTPTTFRERILNSAGELRPTLYRIAGEQPKIPNNYLHYALMLRK